MAKMLVTQALDERDLLDKKIRDKIAKASFVDTMRNNEETVFDARLTKKEYEKQAKASLQQILDLIDRFHKIEAAIVASNAKTMIKTSYGKYTVAGAIALRKRLQTKDLRYQSADFESVLCGKMQNEYQKRIDYAEEENRSLEASAEQMRLSILGKDSKTKESKPLDVVDKYVQENTTELVDPLDIKNRINEMTEKTSALLTELNTQIKVSNATTFIEV